MKQKKLVYIFIVLAISLVLVLPIINLFFILKYQKIHIDHFSKKQLFSTFNLEGMLNYSAYKAFHVSLDQSQVIVGKEKFLFLGNGYASIVDKSTGSYSYTFEQIDDWTTRLKQLQEWYENKGIKFIMVIAPNKHTVYSDKLPNGVVYKEGETITDDIVKSALNKNIHILNLKKALKENKQDRQLYFNMDTHWNYYGAFIGYKRTIEYLNATYKKQYIIPKYDIKKIKSSKKGDLTGLLKIHHLLSDSVEHDYNVMVKQKSKICYGAIDNNTHQLAKCTSGDKNKFNQYALNTSSPNKAKLLYLCDSFGAKNTDMYNATFSTVWRLHHKYINGEVLANFVKKHKPDVVIYQIVERDFGSHNTVTHMP